MPGRPLGRPPPPPSCRDHKSAVRVITGYSSITGVREGLPTNRLRLQSRQYTARASIQKMKHLGSIRRSYELMLVIPTPSDLAAGRDPALADAASLVGLKLPPEQAGKIFPIEWPSDVEQ
jgi:hypothetical protein